MTNAQKKKEHYERLPMAILTFRLSKMEHTIFKMVQAGMTRKSNTLSNNIYERNIMRKTLLKKLREWETNPSCEKLTYSQTLKGGHEI